MRSVWPRPPPQTLSGVDRAAGRPPALFRLLAEEAVDYVVVGGFAVIAHGVVRATKDLDTTAGDLDLMQWIPGIDADHAYATLASPAIEPELDGLAITVRSLGDLLMTKRAAKRSQDTYMCNTSSASMTLSL